MRPEPYEGIVVLDGRPRAFSTRGAVLLADDAVFDGANWERGGRNRFLYRAAGGGFALVTQSRRAGEPPIVAEALSLEGAITVYQSLPAHRVDLPEAFPGLSVDPL